VESVHRLVRPRIATTSPGLARVPLEHGGIINCSQTLSKQDKSNRPKRYRLRQECGSIVGGDTRS